LRAEEDPDTDDLFTVGRLLHETARLWQHRCDRVVRQLPGMTRARCAVLIQLAQHEGVNQAALAQILDIRSMTLVRLLDRLEAAGLIARMPDPQDRRAHVLSLAAKALPIIECIYDLRRKTYDDLQLGISEAEVNQLRAILCRVRSNLVVAPLNDDLRAGWEKRQCVAGSSPIVTTVLLAAMAAGGTQNLPRSRHE
jgi:MarR family transcriptional regulator for hemolysin